MVRPSLENAATFWDPYKLNHIKAIEQVQHRAARFVLNDYSMKTPGCVTKMLSDLNRESLEQRRRHRLLSMMYKICNNRVGINAGSFIYSSDAQNQRPTPADPRKIHWPGTGELVFPPETISECNVLPARTVSAPTLEAFRSLLVE